MSTASTRRVNSGRPEELAFRELIRTFGLVERVMEPYFARFGITGAQWGVLRNLHRAEAEGKRGLRLTDLGERLLVRPPTVTGVVERLCRAGLVEKEEAASDRRARQVSLSVAGRRLVGQVLRVHAQQISGVMAGLEAADQAELYRLLEKLGRHLRMKLEAGRKIRLVHSSEETRDPRGVSS
jgi:MarR family transcriptional regulator for hemolysin